MKKLMIFPAAFIAVLSLNGCATVINGRYQQVSVQTEPPGSYCVLTNNKGQWVVNSTPATIKVHRSMDNLHVSCQKQGYQSDVQSVPSHLAGAMVGNILAGGIIGVGIDAGDGSGYSYPSQINMTLDKSINDQNDD